MAAAVHFSHLTIPAWSSFRKIVGAQCPEQKYFLHKTQPCFQKEAKPNPVSKPTSSLVTGSHMAENLVSWRPAKVCLEMAQRTTVLTRGSRKPLREPGLVPCPIRNLPDDFKNAKLEQGSARHMAH